MAQVAVISGGMGDTGRAIARALASKGYSVALLYRSSRPEDAEKFLRTLDGGPHRALRCDISNMDDVRAAFAELLKDSSERLGVCVHTASDPIARATVEEMDPSTFRAQFEATVFGAFNLISAALPLMKEGGGGLIVGITTSFLETDAKTARMPGYISAKYALRGLLRESAREGDAFGVRVNAIAPDLMRTKFSSDLPARYFEWAAERDPRKRISTVEEVAQRVLFLLSPEGARMNGITLFVDREDAVAL